MSEPRKLRTDAETSNVVKPGSQEPFKRKLWDAIKPVAVAYGLSAAIVTVMYFLHPYYRDYARKQEELRSNPAGFPAVIMTERRIVERRDSIPGSQLKVDGLCTQEGRSLGSSIGLNDDGVYWLHPMDYIVIEGGETFRCRVKIPSSLD